MRQHIAKCAVLTIGFALCGQHQARADAATEAALRAALQTATSQIAALEDQVANLQASEAPNVAMIEALRAKLQTLQAGGAGATESAADRAKDEAAKAKQAAALAALQKQLSARDAKLSKTQSEYAAAAANAQTEASENNALIARVASLQTNVSVCDTKNAQLYALGNKILDAYGHKDDFLGVVANHEPFIGFSRVQLQNIVQDDQDKLDANQILPPGPNN
jgi:chromosome segregation ATPase